MMEKDDGRDEEDDERGDEEDERRLITWIQRMMRKYIRICVGLMPIASH